MRCFTAVSNLKRTQDIENTFEKTETMVALQLSVTHSLLLNATLLHWTQKAKPFWSLQFSKLHKAEHQVALSICLQWFGCAATATATNRLFSSSCFSYLYLCSPFSLKVTAVVLIQASELSRIEVKSVSQVSWNHVAILLL